MNLKIFLGTLCVQIESNMREIKIIEDKMGPVAACEAMYQHVVSRMATYQHVAQGGEVIAPPVTRSIEW